MGTFDVLVRGAQVVGADSVARVDLGILDGLIAGAGPDLEGGATSELDATGLHVFPGVVDPHVHFNDPGRAEWEGFSAGSAAFAAGGGTCFFDMPLNASPPTIDGASFDLKLAAARDTARVDFGLWGGLVPGSRDRLDELADRGVVGFKAFMCDSGIDDFERVDEQTLFEGMLRATRLGLPVAVHAESETITRQLAAQARAEGRHRMVDYLASRPAAAELEAVTRAIALAEEARCSLHVVHASTAAAVLQVAEARARGIDVTCETCPHYLVLTDEDAERIGALAKCSPPLRSRAEVEALRLELQAGNVPIVASDHSPAPLALKEGDDAFAIWGGIAGCQTLLRLLLTECPGSGLDVTEIARLASSGAAQRFRLGRKGSLAIGSDADLVLVDLGATAPLAPTELLYRHRVSPYLGRQLRGQVRRTIVRGTSVFVDGRIVGAPCGRLVRPDVGGSAGVLVNRAIGA